MVMLSVCRLAQMVWKSALNRTVLVSVSEPSYPSLSRVTLTYSVCIGRQIYQTTLDPIARTAPAGTQIAKGTSSRKPPNKPPPRPAKLPHVPLTYWYVGPFPLDPEQPLKTHPSLRERNKSPDNYDGRDPEDKIFTGMEVLTGTEDPPKRLDPPVRPGEGGTGKKRKPTGGSEGMTGSDKSKGGRRKSVPGKVGSEAEGVKVGSSSAKKKARKSTAT